MNWKQLKDFCNRLPDSELEKNVILWREGETITKIEAEELEEDHYIDIEYPENGCFPKFQMKSFIEQDEDAYPNGEKDFKKCYNKGHPILYEEF